MAHDTKLAHRIRERLNAIPKIKVEEKKMFRGLSFMVNGKMCVSVSGENLMCRFDPEQHDIVEGKKGFKPMIMKQRKFKGFCYVSQDAIKSKRDFDYWMNLCLEFNDKAKASRKKKK